MFIKGFLSIQSEDGILRVPLRNDIQVSGWQEAQQFIAEVTKATKGSTEQIIGCLYTLVKNKRDN